MFSSFPAGGNAVRAQIPEASAVEPAAISTERQRRKYEEKAKFLTDRLRPNAKGELLNRADESDLREITRRFEEGAKWWRAAGNYVKEYEALDEVAGNYAALNNFQAALKTGDQMLTAARATNKPSLEFSALTGVGQFYRQIKAPRRALKYLYKALRLLQSEEMRRDWRLKYDSGEYADSILARYSYLSLSRTEILDRQIAADLSLLETQILMNLADIHRQLRKPTQAAELSVKALAAAQRTAGSGIPAFGYGEIFKITRAAAQSYIDAGNRARAVRLVKDETIRAAGNPELEKKLSELLALIKSGGSNLKGVANW